MESSKNIFIVLENNAISTIEFFVKPDGKTYPPSQLPEDERLLKGFIWREGERPITKDHIFIRDNEISNDVEKLPIIKNNREEIIQD